MAGSDRASGENGALIAMPLKSRLALVVGLVSSGALAADSAAADVAGLMSDSAAREAVQVALETKPSGAAYAWQSLAGSIAGKVTPRRTFRTESGHFCREFTELITDGVDTVTLIHIACRDQDGYWVIAEE